MKMTVNELAEHLKEHELECRVLQFGAGWRAILLQNAKGFFYPLMWDSHHADPFTAILDVIAKHRTDAMDNKVVAGRVMA